MDIVSSGLNIDLGRLNAYASSAARLLAVDGVCPARREEKRLRAELRELKRCHASLQAKEARGEELTAAEEWILDNFYLAQREAQSAAAVLRRAGELRSAGGDGLVFALCRALLRAGGGKLNEERLQCFLDGFQSVCPLRQSELETLGVFARCAVVSALAEVCRAMEGSGGDAEDRAGCAPILSALFAALRNLPLMDLDTLLEHVNMPGLIFALDATGDYPHMDAQTKRDYLRRLEHLAETRGTEATALARELIERSRSEGRHIGFYLFEEERSARGEIYLSAKFALAAALTLSVVFIWGLWAGLLLFLPISEATSDLADLILSRFVRPRRLPRMDMSRGIPPEGKTVCVISVLLTGASGAARAARRLEKLYFAGGGAQAGGALVFGLLADLPAASERDTEADAAALTAAEGEIRAMNEKYGGGFCLFTRPRSFDGEGWCGRERKRGALCALARQLTGEQSELELRGDVSALEGTRYILTVDSDTEIYPGSVAELIGAALHPLVRPVVDSERGTVVRGHAVIQPRMSVTLASAAATDFAILFSGGGGSDPYGALCGELMMDAFAAGGFTGKGLIEPEALLRCTAERLDAKGILSHDAPEGAYLRGARMGDEEFFDAFPSAPEAYFRRLHRWVRGDWQNLRFLFARELPAVERARFFAKLRHSAVPVVTLAALMAGFLSPARAGAAAAAAALCLLSDLILALAEELRRPRRVRTRRWTRILVGFGGAIVKNFMRLWLLPWEAWVCLSAASAALWRMAVSHRRLLEWETAAQSEARRGGLGDYARAMLPVLPLGLAAMLFSEAVIGRAAGLMWLLSPITAWALGLSAATEKTLSARDRDYLRAAAGDTWHYFSALCTPQGHGLPPDNFQSRPARGAAHSVSPTNLGLAMTAAVAACDLKLIEREEALRFLEGLCAAAERLPRFRGHFFNWYDTLTLSPLSPPFISTVDSGNCCAALLTAAAFAAETGGEELASRLRALAEGMDFSFLYDETRSLFVICYDTQRERAAGGWYDLMASEAMLTSYLAVARGEVPRRHWRALSRACLRQDGYCGLASWTGTMFEYLMPALFLPLEKGSLLDESARFCLYAQKMRVAPGIPWGISESAFFSLDATGRYRYKAHGVGALALRRGMDEELVVSPYSSFLALPLDPHGAVENLLRLERHGMRGPYGFFEAIDYTHARGVGEEGERVQCTMAHHAAMSLCAAANALCGGSIVRRFFSDPRIEAFCPLLCERMDEGGTVLRRGRSRENSARSRVQRELTRTGGPGEKGFCLLSNGDLTVFLDEMGEKGAALGDLVLSDARLGGTSLNLCRGKRTLPLMPSVCARWEMSSEHVRYEYTAEGFRGSLTVSVGGEENGLLYELAASGLEEPAEAELSLIPLLAPLSDALDHPAFARLGVFAQEKDDVLLLRRIARRGRTDLYLAAACSRPADMSAEKGGGSGTLLRPALRLRAPLENGGEPLRFALCAASDAAEAAEGAKRLLGGTGRGRFVTAAATLLGMKEQALGGAMALAAALRSPAPREAAPRSELWKYGVSGDLPILLCSVGAREEEELLEQFCLLRSLNVGAELVFVSDEEGEYLQRSRERIEKHLTRLRLEALLDVPGGVRIVPRQAREVFASRAVFIAGETPCAREALPSLAERERSGVGAIPYTFDGAGGFRFQLPGALPPKPWQALFTARDRGWLVSGSGSGWMWWKNAREGRVNPPPPTPESTAGSEQLWVETPVGRVSLFAAEDGVECRVSFSPFCARWEKTIGGRKVMLTGFLDPASGARVLLLSGAEGMTVCWRLETVIGAADGAAVRCGFSDGLFHAENPESFFPDMRFLAGVSAPARCRCDWTEAGMLLSFTAGKNERLVCGVCDEETLRALLPPAAAKEALAAALAAQAAQRELFSLRCSDKRLEHYMNGWCLAQVRARLEARTSLYQSGGAIGFRDQLQDAVNLLLVESGSARERILDACRHQYAEGDVMHWWHAHPDGDRGVRTRCSDDLLWLCWALGEYTEATGDDALCREQTPWLVSPPLAETEHDRYETPETSAETAGVLDHALRALKCCIGRGFGPHGLPLMGAGDWNDALSDCGGESVWLAFFLCCCARSTAKLLERVGRADEARRCRALSERMLGAAEGCFNGKWYGRAFPAHGDISRGGRRIDSIVQSWAVFCGAKHAGEALDHALCRLVDGEKGLVKLLDPPFAADEERFGYITSYGEGCRENGGQYTHAAVWLARACFRAGRPEAGHEILSMLLPEGREIARYGAEPYVLPADVCAAPGHEGEAGWTWYTGSAGWFFRTVTEDLLGLRCDGGRITAAPSACALFEVDELTVRGEKVITKGLPKRKRE